MNEHCRHWFEVHSADDFSSPLECMNAFMRYVSEGGMEENRPKATLQTYVLVRYAKNNIR